MREKCMTCCLLSVRLIMPRTCERLLISAAPGSFPGSAIPEPLRLHREISKRRRSISGHLCATYLAVTGEHLQDMLDTFGQLGPFPASLALGWTSGLMSDAR